MIARPTRGATSDRGKKAEQDVRLWLEAESARRADFAFHRYPDAKAARGTLAAQPADFLVGVATPVKRAVHLEVKETKQLTRLPKAKISQYGKLLMFHMAGFETIVLVNRTEHNDWVCFTQRDLFRYEECPASFPFTGLHTYFSAAAALSEIF